ncbi:serine/threonine-protein kinase STY13 [Pelomyxa schiedti]|nr:serine/threonine-protein kinase STY13 [Pelomyxa schiedti]
MTWWWNSSSIGHSNVSYSMFASLGITEAAGTVDGQNVGATEFTLDAPGTGVISSDPSSFVLSLVCDAAFTASVDLYLALTGLEFNQDSFNASILSASLAWECALPGCSSHCGDHGGVCEYLLGECLCNGTWTGTYCAIQFELAKIEICPQEQLVASYFIPAYIEGILAVNYAWYGVLDLTWHYHPEWRFLSTWTTSALAENDPGRDSDISASNRTANMFLWPGLYQVDVSSDSLSYSLFSIPFIIKDWGSCGFTDIECGEDKTNTCHSELGYGECNVDTSTCSCLDSHFWFDCSRGCSGFHEVFNSSGVLQSDNPLPEHEQSRTYIPSTSCIWMITPPGDFWTIDLDFLSFSVDYSDSLSIYRIEPDAEINSVSNLPPDGLITSLSGLNATPLSIRSKRIALVLQADYATAGTGFVVQYKTSRREMPILGRVFTAIMGIVVLALVCTAVTIFSWCWLKQKRAKKLSALNEPAQFTPPNEFEGLHFDEAEVQGLLKEYNVEVNHTVLAFGNSSKVKTPILEWKEDRITLSAKKKPISFIFSVPDIPDTVQFDIRPGRGVINPGSAITVSIKVCLMYTTHFTLPIKLDVLDNIGITMGKPILFDVNLDGALSTRLDPAEIKLDPAPIASGAFGSVYKGRYRAQIIAVKVLKNQGDLQECERNEFVNECDVMAGLHHPYIVGYIGACYVPGKLCICTELIPNGNLGKFLTSGVDIPYSLLLKFATNIAEAVAYLHSNNFIYRDLKCSNVLVVSTLPEAQVTCKLCDFGTARHIDDPEIVRKYTNRAGTLIYMAPEYFTTKMYNTKVDVYSMGSCLHQMWTHEEPWTDTVVWEIPQKVSSGMRPIIPDDCPEQYADLIRQCWDENPNHRPEFFKIVSVLKSMLADLDETQESKESHHHIHRHRHRHRHNKNKRRSSSHHRHHGNGHHKHKDEHRHKPRPKPDEIEMESLSSSSDPENSDHNSS